MSRASYRSHGHTHTPYQAEEAGVGGGREGGRERETREEEEEEARGGHNHHITRARFFGLG